MKTKNLYTTTFFLIMAITFSSCGPVIISSRPSHPAPPWFYPNRVVNVRYVYFPDYMIYYDLTLRSYIYLDNGIWINVTTLPSRFNTINFRRTKQIRVNNYFGDDIRDYHKRRSAVKGRRTSTNQSKSRRGS